MAKMKLGIAALAVLPLFGACSTQPPLAVPSPAPSVEATTPTPAAVDTASASAPAPTVEATPSPTWTPVRPTATPKPTPTVDAKKQAEVEAAKQKAAEEKKAKRAEAEKEAKAEAEAKKKAADAASAANAAKSSAESENKADTQATAEGKGASTPTGPVTFSDECAATTVRYKDKGKCADEAMTALKAAGYYSGKVDGTYGNGAANWTVHYQRSHGLKQTGTMTAETWESLKANKPAIGAFLAGSCKGSGVRVCVHLASQTLYWVEDGQVAKTVKVRTAGWNQDRNNQWRMHGTPKGQFTVYDKAVNPSSPRYGEGAMPYSTMFDPNVYFHYSAGFAKVGYSGSSHGCVNIGSKADAKWIMDNTPIGAKVVIY